jgi:hypothetical protein
MGPKYAIVVTESAGYPGLINVDLLFRESAVIVSAVKRPIRDTVLDLSAAQMETLHPYEMEGAMTRVITEYAGDLQSEWRSLPNRAAAAVLKIIKTKIGKDCAIIAADPFTLEVMLEAGFEPGRTELVMLGNFAEDYSVSCPKLSQVNGLIKMIPKGKDVGEEVEQLTEQVIFRIEKAINLTRLDSPRQRSVDRCA